MLIKKLRIGFVLLLAVMIVATPTMFLAQGQVNPSHQQDLIEIADNAQQKVEALFEWIESQEIEDIELQADIASYEVLFEEGKTLLQETKDAVEEEDYERAVEDALDALRIFRNVLKAVNTSLEEAGIDTGELGDNQGFLEAIVRARYEDDLSDATYYLRQANQLISQVHSLLKEEAGLSNEWRIFDYCERTRQRTRERFRHGSDQGINIDAFLESLGYQHENQFMETLEALIQNAKNNSENFKDSLDVLEAIGNMIRQMDGELTQEINRHQNRHGSGSNYGGSSSGQSIGNP